jgi:hypothetical protein
MYLHPISALMQAGGATAEIEFSFAVKAIT